jgi:hypothetical protein
VIFVTAVNRVAIFGFQLADNGKITLFVFIQAKISLQYFRKHIIYIKSNKTESMSR